MPSRDILSDGIEKLDPTAPTKQSRAVPFPRSAANRRNQRVCCWNERLFTEECIREQDLANKDQESGPPVPTRQNCLDSH